MCVQKSGFSKNYKARQQRLPPHTSVFFCFREFIPTIYCSFCLQVVAPIESRYSFMGWDESLELRGCGFKPSIGQKIPTLEVLGLYDPHGPLKLYSSMILWLQMTTYPTYMCACDTTIWQGCSSVLFSQAEKKCIYYMFASYLNYWLDGNFVSSI